MLTYSFSAALGISAPCRSTDLTASLLSRAGIRSLFFHMQCFVKSIGRVTKPMCHPFQTNMSYMCHACEIWRSKIVHFWTVSKWATEYGICDEPQVRTRFWCYNPVVLCCTIVKHAIGEQWSYAAKISFVLIAHHKSMLCRPLLSGFKTYPFL
jgi:hypothetical protein